MELSSSVSSTAAAAAQARLLRPPSFRQPGPAGFVSCRSYAIRSKLVRAMPPILASFQPASPRYPSFQDANGKRRNDIFVKPQHKIVIVEGNYLLLEEDVWTEIRDLFDEKWFIDIDIDISMQRVLKRHIATGKEPDVAAWRISYNDRPNAELILESRKNADLVIRSVDFSS
ncbi:P-loop containing nucleoside triphosphate hydrolase superfamily protein [Zea mays]|uniref:p-loop containing nucleoside triphosphate hydrolase superfamily protein n=1 Tax=Zea mays TaxID=4577 RepID=A0A1D6MVX0_MAIZE|nr:P-loop containing nucleoside triphosphate hydrolase superfamily protein [Zea mays]